MAAAEPNGDLPVPSDIPFGEVSLGVFPPADPSVPEGSGVDATLDAVSEPDVGIEGGDVSSAMQSSAIQIGTGRSGIISMDEWAEAADAPANGSADLTEVEGAAEGDEDPFAGFGDAPVDPADAPIAEAADPFAEPFVDPGPEADPAELAADAQAEILPMAVAAAAASAPAKTRQGGVGQMIGVVLGGLMALPVTYAILVWGFQKDPFKLTKMLPPQVSFLLPAKFQPGYRRPAAPDKQFSGASTLDSLASLPVPAEPAATEEAAAPAEEAPMPAAAEEAIPAATPAADGLNADAVIADALGTDATPVSDSKPEPADSAEEPVADATAASPAAIAPPLPEPLDLSGLDAAVEKASAALDSLVAVADPEDPARRRRLVGWYKTLATVGEELAQLERVASDTGRPLNQLPDSLASLQGRIAGSGELIDELEKLGRMWLTSQKRPADGVVLLARFGAARQVGPYWCSRVSLADADGTARDIAVISRVEPVAVDGDRVLLTGVLFDGDVVWAADCRRLEAPATTSDVF